MLVQRVLERSYGPDNDTKGVDRYFKFDYMGSSEFEWGALPKAIAEFRSVEVYGPAKLNIGEYSLWLVGSESSLSKAEEFFDDQLRPRPERTLRLKERSSLADRLSGEYYDPSLIGWWCLKDNWVLFMKKSQAEAWLKGLQER